jgi:hypothetical protein
MRTFVSIFLLAIFAVPFFWGPSWLSMEKRQIQKHVRNNILPSVDESELVIFEVSASDTSSQFKWKHAKEFEFNGKMYDIVDRKQTDDDITYLVWQDDEETAINSKIKLVTNSIFDNSPVNQNNRLAFQLLIQSLYAEETFDCICAPMLSINNSFYSSYKACTHRDFSGAVFQPPQV